MTIKDTKSLVYLLYVFVCTYTNNLMYVASSFFFSGFGTEKIDRSLLLTNDILLVNIVSMQDQYHIQ